ncbi:MAG: hypothetical protein K2X29_11925 [Candidatus Obscuribacterales bacterium]|nr:hypothetical protein [Candidatus Obscuribacterales bacterium]
MHDNLLSYEPGSTRKLDYEALNVLFELAHLDGPIKEFFRNLNNSDEIDCSPYVVPSFTSNGNNSFTA